jgi:hypothetical protein
MLDLTENNKQLVPFLRNLADSVESNTISPEKLQYIGEFYMSCKFFDENKTQETENDDSIDIVKFITLGWYMYKVLLSKPEDETINEID